MTATQPTKTMHFNSPLEAKSFAAGKIIAERKLQGHHRPTAAEIEATTIARGKAEVLKKLGAASYRKMFGVDPPTPAPATKPAPTAPTRAVKTYHRYACKNWLPALA